VLKLQKQRLKKYLKLAKKYHPDTAKPEFLLKSDINIFMVNEAYSCITNSSNKYNTNIRDINKYSNNTAIYNIFELINNSSDLEFDIFDEDKKKRKK